jgi:microsomal dipeptidase-like Zn-dependent dipeptidase
MKGIKSTTFFLFLVLFLGISTPKAALPNKPDPAQAVGFADAHIHHGLTYENGDLKLLNFDYFEQRGLQIISYPMPIKREITDNLVAVIKAEVKDLRALSKKSNKFQVLDAPVDNTTEFKLGVLTVFLSIEYFDGVFGGEPESVEEYRQMGIRSITLIDNDIDRFFNNNQLTTFGEQVIHRMNEAGILLDISHLSEAHSIEAIRFSKAPVIVSHAAAQTVSGNEASLSDELLTALGDKCGYVFTTFNRNDLFDSEEAIDDGIGRFIKHVVYLTKMLGINHVGIGSDYQAMGKYVPSDLNEIDTFRKIQAGLRETGFSDEEITRISSGVFLNSLARKTRVYMGTSPEPGGFSCSFDSD